ncbi:hypothetical protein V8C86DRAFT_2445660, partial [Haematococcus lacustris]
QNSASLLRKNAALQSGLKLLAGSTVAASQPSHVAKQPSHSNTPPTRPGNLARCSRTSPSPSPPSPSQACPSQLRIRLGRVYVLPACCPITRQPGAVLGIS